MCSILCYVHYDSNFHLNCQAPASIAVILKPGSQAQFISFLSLCVVPLDVLERHIRTTFLRFPAGKQ